LLDIPDWGKSALPSAAAAKDGEENNIAADKRTPSVKHILKEYAEKHPEAPYISIAGIWYPEKELYKYEIYPLDFKPEVIKQADGETMFYSYSLRLPEKGLYHIMGAIVPKNIKAAWSMTYWLAADYKELAKKINKIRKNNYAQDQKQQDT